MYIWSFEINTIYLVYSNCVLLVWGMSYYYDIFDTSYYIADNGETLWTQKADYAAENNDRV